MTDCSGYFRAKLAQENLIAASGALTRSSVPRNSWILRRHRAGEHRRVTLGAILYGAHQYTEARPIRPPPDFELSRPEIRVSMPLMCLLFMSSRDFRSRRSSPKHELCRVQ